MQSLINYERPTQILEENPLNSSPNDLQIPEIRRPGFIYKNSKHRSLLKDA